MLWLWDVFNILLQLYEVFIVMDVFIIVQLSKIIFCYFELVGLLILVLIEIFLVLICDGGVIVEGFDVELDELCVISENVGQFLVDLEEYE